jgi:glycosyltransferase involved in cell wall biosynthesis
VRILVYPHTMEVGGSQLNAVELAGAVRDRGHEVLVASAEGPLVSTVDALGLERVPLRPGRVPSPVVAARLVRLARERGLDVVHGYEWPPGMEAFLGPRLRLGRAAVCTVMSMAVAPFLPRCMPVVVGTEQIRAGALAAGFRSVTLIEPPVDVVGNHPGFDPGGFRARHGLAAEVPLVAVVCRLVPDLKREGLLAAVDAVAALDADTPCQLVIVGDGRSRAEIAARAAAVNAACGRTVAVLTGELADPRPAYAAADVLLGMGGSALRGMAFGRPLVVQGERGFWRLLTPESTDEFLHQGWYGVGDGCDGAARLAGILRGLLADPEEQARLGKYARELVVDRFSLQRAAAVQEEVYAGALAARGFPPPGDLVRSAAGLATYKVRRKVAKLRGVASTDDFNVLRGKR